MTFAPGDQFGELERLDLELWTGGSSEKWAGFRTNVAGVDVPSAVDEEGENDEHDLQLLGGSESGRFLILLHMHVLSKPDPDGDVFHCGVALMPVPAKTTPPDEVVKESERWGGAVGVLTRFAEHWPGLADVRWRYDARYSFPEERWSLEQLPTRAPVPLELPGYFGVAEPFADAWSIKPALEGLHTLSIARIKKTLKVSCNGTWRGTITKDFPFDVAPVVGRPLGSFVKPRTT